MQIGPNSKEIMVESNLVSIVWWDKQRYFASHVPLSPNSHLEFDQTIFKCCAKLEICSCFTWQLSKTGIEKTQFHLLEKPSHLYCSTIIYYIIAILT